MTSTATAHPTADRHSTSLREQLILETARVFRDPGFQKVVPTFCERISLIWSRLKGAGLPVDDIGGFAIATFLAIAPMPPTEKELTDFCALMKLASRTRVRALLGRLKSNGLVEVRQAGHHAGRLALHATPALRSHFQHWIHALAELIEPWTEIPATEVDDALVAQYLQVTHNAYQQGYVLFEHFPIVRFFMGRSSGYSLFLTLTGSADEHGTATLNRAQFAKQHLTSRAHASRLLKECEEHGWLRREKADRVTFAPEMKEEALRWIAAEIAWTSYGLRTAKLARNRSTTTSPVSAQ